MKERLKPTVRPVASRTLFFNLQVVRLLLAEYTLFACGNLCYPTTRVRSYFSTIFAAHLRMYMLRPRCEIVHFMKWTTQLSISRNGQNIYPFREMDKNSTVHFMKWTTKCTKFLLSLTVKKHFFFIFIET